MAKQVIKILDDLSPSEIKLRDLSRKPDGLYNMHFNEYGQLVKRAGFAKYNTTAITLEAEANHKIVGMHPYYKQDLTKKFLVAWYKNIYYLDANGDHTEHSIKSDLTANSDTYFADFLNTCYMLNGVNGVFKYNDNGFGPVGVTVPAKPIVNADSNGGSLGTGNYKFCYTYVDVDGYEGNPSPESEAEAVTGTQHVDVTLIVSGTLTKVIYRTAVGGAIFYKDGTANAAATNHPSIKADGELGSIVKTNHTAPESTSHLITKRRNKLYLAYQDYLYPSHTSDVEYFPPLWRLRTGNSQKIMGLLEQLTALPVMTDDSIERLVGTDEDNFEFRNSYSTEGCIATRSLVNCDNLLIYLGFNGINYFDGVNSGIFSQALNEYIKENIVASKASLSCATYWNNKYILCYPKKGEIYPTETIWYDLKNKTYGIYSYAFSCFSRWDRGDDGLRLFGGSNTIGRVYELTGLTDYNESEETDDAITAYDSPEPIDLGLPEIYKQWYSIFVKVKTTTGTAFHFDYKLDNAADWTRVNKTLTEDTTKWYRISLGGGGKRARSLKPRPYMSDKFNFEIHGYIICYDFEIFAEEKE